MASRKKEDFFEICAGILEDIADIAHSCGKIATASKEVVEKTGELKNKSGVVPKEIKKSYEKGKQVKGGK